MLQFECLYNYSASIWRQSIELMNWNEMSTMIARKFEWTGSVHISFKRLFFSIRYSKRSDNYFDFNRNFYSFHKRLLRFNMVPHLCNVYHPVRWSVWKLHGVDAVRGSRTTVWHCCCGPDECQALTDFTICFHPTIHLKTNLKIEENLTTIFCVVSNYQTIL